SSHQRIAGEDRRRYFDRYFEGSGGARSDRGRRFDCERCDRGTKRQGDDAACCRNQSSLHHHAHAGKSTDDASRPAICRRGCACGGLDFSSPDTRSGRFSGSRCKRECKRASGDGSNSSKDKMIQELIHLWLRGWRSAFEVILLSVAIYYGYLYFRGTRGAKV